MLDELTRRAADLAASGRAILGITGCPGCGKSTLAEHLAALAGIQPSTAKRHLADLRARSGLTTVELIYAGRAAGWLVVPSLEPG